MNPWAQLLASIGGSIFGNAFGDKSGNYGKWAQMQANEYLWPILAAKSRLTPQALQAYWAATQQAGRDAETARTVTPDTDPMYREQRSVLDANQRQADALTHAALARQGLERSPGAQGAYAAEGTRAAGNLANLYGGALTSEQNRRDLLSQRYNAMLGGAAGMFDPSSQLASLSSLFGQQGQTGYNNQLAQGGAWADLFGSLFKKRQRDPWDGSPYGRAMGSVPSSFWNQYEGDPAYGGSGGPWG